jgi:hypothetical protein
MTDQNLVTDKSTCPYHHPFPTTLVSDNHQTNKLCTKVSFRLTWHELGQDLARPNKIIQELTKMGVIGLTNCLVG